MEWLAEYTKFINTNMNFKHFVESDNKESIDEKAKYFWSKIDKLKFPENNKMRLPHQIGKIDEFAILLVDGDKVKTKHFMDFVEGGNYARYKWIPKNEMWLDSRMDPKSWKHILLHEMIECYMMDKLDYSYEKAHDIANTYEKPKIEK